jgi:hypothetical protein
MKSPIPSGWHIELNKKPIPSRQHDYDFYHDNYDYCSIEGGNGLCGTASSQADAIKQINELECV